MRSAGLGAERESRVEPKVFFFFLFSNSDQPDPILFNLFNKKLQFTLGEIKAKPPPFFLPPEHLMRTR